MDIIYPPVIEICYILPESAALRLSLTVYLTVDSGMQIYWK